MYASSYFLIVITALSAGALAVPNDMTRMLHERGDPAGSITGHWDDHCCDFLKPGELAPDGSTVGDPAVDDGNKFKCLTFGTPAPFIGVNFGASQSMRAFRDGNCDDPDHIIATVHHPDTNEAGGDGEAKSKNVTDGQWNCAKKCFSKAEVFLGTVTSVQFSPELVPY